jgi:ATP-dependent helicase/nuclease subunit A
MRPSDEIARSALDPARSVVVEACAGSGKTWLLVSRIVRLLLSGVRPSEILAITFTRKAAQEVEARLRDWLRGLALKPDDEVRAFLRQRAVPEEEIGGLLPRARRLYEEFLIAQPGITVDTFHGWFLQMLQRAPLESGLGGGWALLEQTSTLLEESWESFAEDLGAEPDSETACALNVLFREHGLYNTRNLLLAFVARRGEWWAYTGGASDPLAFAAENLRRALKVDPDVDVLGQFFDDAGLAGEFDEFAALLEKNTATDSKLAAQLRRALALEDLTGRFDGVCAVFFTKEGSPRKREYSPTLAKRLGEGQAVRLLRMHQEICARLLETRDALAARSAYGLNLAGLRCGMALLGVYQRLKTERQLMDFTDVEWGVHRLLAHSEYAGYMQYKLDSRYRHILLDEFQDTNPLQWQILRAWLEASAGAGNPPSVFLVGDPKQAIYRFRRADARLFGIAADFLRREFGAALVRQTVSRRSAAPVLEAVNRVFASEPGFAGFERHAAHDGAMWGRVEVLPLAKGEDQLPERHGLSPSAFRNPLREPAAEAEQTRYEEEARRVAERIGTIVGSWAVAEEGELRPAQFRDILLLKRSRARLEVYERALRAARIPYVSSRQGGLLDTLECSDVIALLTFLITPFADLALAQALRSPVFGCDDGDLIVLARLPAGSWWERLQRAASEKDASPALRRARSLLSGWLRLTDTLPVHDLLDRIYFEGDLPARYAEAVPDAMRGAVIANLHAFMELALKVDSGRYPSLPKFINELALLRAAPAEEAPDEGLIGDVGNAVRILTIHGAKGLEAPIVWLLDANPAPKRDNGYRTLVDWPPERPAPRHFFLYGGKRERAPQWAPLFSAEAELEAREDLNLLYVAMTRARHALIVSGVESARTGGRESWHGKIRRAVAGDEVGTETAAIGEAPVAAPPSGVPTEAVSGPILPVGPALSTPVGKRVGERKTPARRHGIALHAMLEWITPPQPLTDRKTLQGLLELDGEEFEEAWRTAGELTAAPHLRHFFDPGAYLNAWKEVAYRTATGDSRRIDRLVEFADSVWVLDFKAAEGVTPASLADHAAPYLAQMREYRAAMERAFAPKPVRCALVFQNGLLYEVEG